MEGRDILLLGLASTVLVLYLVVAFNNDFFCDGDAHGSFTELSLHGMTTKYSSKDFRSQLQSKGVSDKFTLYFSLANSFLIITFSNMIIVVVFLSTMVAWKYISCLKKLNWSPTKSLKFPLGASCTALIIALASIVLFHIGWPLAKDVLSTAYNVSFKLCVDFYLFWVAIFFHFIFTFVLFLRYSISKGSGNGAYTFVA